MKATGKKCLIAYFSRRGQNYVSGRIVDLKVDNTKVVAPIIQKKTGGDLFHIETVIAYPRDYTETDTHLKERENGRTPGIAPIPEPPDSLRCNRT